MSSQTVRLCFEDTVSNMIWCNSSITCRNVTWDQELPSLLEDIAEPLSQGGDAPGKWQNAFSPAAGAGTTKEQTSIFELVEKSVVEWVYLEGLQSMDRIHYEAEM